MQKKCMLASIPTGSRYLSSMCPCRKGKTDPKDVNIGITVPPCMIFTVDTALVAENQVVIPGNPEKRFP